uniref:Uncharacterized protein n=1 Tax=Anopheles culicifacies TaxID=139723 RepID=A0A182LXN6_9DIPT
MVQKSTQRTTKPQRPAPPSPVLPTRPQRRMSEILGISTRPAADSTYSTVPAKALQQQHHEAIPKINAIDNDQTAKKNGTVSSQQPYAKKTHAVDTVTAAPITDARSKRSKSPPRSCSTGKSPEMANRANVTAVNGSGGTGGDVGGFGVSTGATNISNTIRGSGPNGELTLKDVPVSGISFQEIFKPDHEGPPTTQVIIYKPKSGKGQPTAKVIVTKVCLHQHVQHGPVKSFICLGTNQGTGDTRSQLRTVMQELPVGTGTWTARENSSHYVDPDAALHVGQQIQSIDGYPGSTMYPSSSAATPHHYQVANTPTPYIDVEAGEQQILQRLRPSYSSSILDVSGRDSAKAHVFPVGRPLQQQPDVLARPPWGWSEQMRLTSVPQHIYPVRNPIEWNRRAYGLSLSCSSPALGPAASNAYNRPVQHIDTVGRLNQQSELYQQAVQRSVSNLSDFWAEAMVNRTSDQPHRSWDYERIMAPIQTHRREYAEGRISTATATSSRIVPSPAVVNSYRTSIPSAWEAQQRNASFVGNVPSALVAMPSLTVQSAPVPQGMVVHSIESPPYAIATPSACMRPIEPAPSIDNSNRGVPCLERTSTTDTAPAESSNTSVSGVNSRIKQVLTIPLSTSNMTMTVSVLSPSMAPLPAISDTPRPVPADVAIPRSLLQRAQENENTFPSTASDRTLAHHTVSNPQPSVQEISGLHQALVAPAPASVSEHHQIIVSHPPMVREETIVISPTEPVQMRAQAVAVQQPEVQFTKPLVPLASSGNQGEELWTPELNAEVDREVATVCSRRQLSVAPPSMPVVQGGAQLSSLPIAAPTLDYEDDVVGEDLAQPELASYSTSTESIASQESIVSSCRFDELPHKAAIIDRSHRIASAPLPAGRTAQTNRTIKLTQSATHIMFATPPQQQTNSGHTATSWDFSCCAPGQNNSTLDIEITKLSVEEINDDKTMSSVSSNQLCYSSNAEYLEYTDSDDESPSFDVTVIHEEGAEELQVRDESRVDEEEGYNDEIDEEYDDEEDEDYYEEGEEKFKEDGVEYEADDGVVQVKVKKEVIECAKIAKLRDAKQQDVTEFSAAFVDCKPSTSGAYKWNLQRQGPHLKTIFYRDAYVHKKNSDVSAVEEDENYEDVSGREHTLCPGRATAQEPVVTYMSRRRYRLYEAPKDLDFSSQSSNESNSSSSCSSDTNVNLPADDCHLVDQERGYESPDEKCTPNDIESRWTSLYPSTVVEILT